MHWRSKLIHPGAHAPANFRSLATPTYRGSTVLFERQADVSDDWRRDFTGSSSIFSIADLDRALCTMDAPA